MVWREWQETQMVREHKTWVFMRMLVCLGQRILHEETVSWKPGNRVERQHVKSVSFNIREIWKIIYLYLFSDAQTPSPAALISNHPVSHTPMSANAWLQSLHCLTAAVTKTSSLYQNWNFFTIGLSFASGMQKNPFSKSILLKV